MGTVAAFDAWLLADPANPLVRTGRGIAGLARLAAFESARVDILAASKERAEQRDLLAGRRLLADVHPVHSFSELARSP
jgi:hypothetical protein